MMVGVNPVSDALGRVNKLEVIPLEQLGRPRVDVVVNCSGVFRDLFVNQMILLDRAIKLAAEQDEPEDMNFVRKHAREQVRALWFIGSVLFMLLGSQCMLQYILVPGRGAGHEPARGGDARVQQCVGQLQQQREPGGGEQQLVRRAAAAGDVPQAQVLRLQLRQVGSFLCFPPVQQHPERPNQQPCAGPARAARRTGRPSRRP